jgi:purine-binding chemotaxis protein CheW
VPALSFQENVSDAAQFRSELLTFRLGEKQFGIEMASIREIVRIPRITRVPLSPDYVLGVMNLRGSIIPVLSGPARLGRASAAFTAQSRVLVLADGRTLLGFTVDAVDRILAISAKQIEAVPGEENKAAGGLLSGVIKQKGETIFRIAPDRLMEGAVNVSAQSSAHISRRKEEQISKTAEQTRRMVAFEIGREEFGIEIGVISEVIRFVLPNPVPDSPPFLAGLITLRSAVLPVIELRALMQRPSLREEILRAVTRLREEYDKAHAALARPHACAAILGKTHRLLEKLGLRSTAAMDLAARNADTLACLRSNGNGALSSTGDRIRALAAALEQLESDSADDSDRRVLVIEKEGARFGLAVDRITQVLDVPESSLQPPPPIAQQSGVQLSALARLENPPRLVLLLDLAEMIARNRLTSVRAHAAAGPDDLMPADHRSALTQWVSFITGEEEFGLPISDVVEIGRLETITRVPSAPKFIQGVINLRGEIVPVINLRKRFGLEAETTSQSRIVYVRSGAVKIGLVVDRVLEILGLSEVEVEPPPAAICSKRVAEYLEGIAKIKDRVLLLLSAGMLLTRSEQEGLESASQPQAGAQTKAAAKPQAAAKLRSKRSS